MENILWKEELEDKHVCVLLSGDDHIVDAGEVGSTLREERKRGGGRRVGWKFCFFSGLDHAMVFDTRERRRPVLDVVCRFVRLAE